MTDHSLQGYLERRTTKELQALRMLYLQKEKDAYFEYILHEIENLLQERYKQEQLTKADIR